MSMNPGATTWPEASSSRSPRRPFPTPTMRPSATATSAARAGAPEPSISEPPRITMSPSTAASSHRPHRRHRSTGPPASSQTGRGRAQGGAVPRSGARETEHLGDAVITPGGVAAVDHQRVAGDERGVGGQEEGSGRGDLGLLAESTQFVLLDDLPAGALHTFAEDRLGHGRVEAPFALVLHGIVP